MTEHIIRPTLARRHLGRTLRRLRQETGKTHADVTAAHLGSRSKMSAIESGRVPVGADTIYGLSALYHVPPELTERLLALAAATKRTGVDESVDPSIAERSSVYADLVDTASVLRVHGVELIPGLVQTEDYARAVVAVDPELTPESVEQRIAFQLRRQHAFLRRRPPGKLDIIITAATLNLVVGSAEVMERQLAHLRALDATDEVSIRVLTTANGVHRAMRGGGFTIMEFDDPLDPPIVHLEHVVGDQYVEREEHVNAYRQAFDAISALTVPLGEHRAGDTAATARVGDRG